MIFSKLRQSAIATATVALALGTALVLPGTAQATGNAYYVNCAAGSNGTGTLASPFNTLAGVNALTLGAGDTVSFDRGTTCLGMLTPKGGGTSASPVVIGAYGTGTAPSINANGQTQAVYLNDTPYTTVQDLDVTAPGDNSTVRRGVYVYASNAGTVSGILLQRLTVHDVRGLLPTSANIALGKYSNASGGIMVEAAGTTTPTSFDGLKILDNTVRSVDREGIYTWSNWCKRTQLAAFWSTLCTANWNPISNLTVSGNTLSDIGGDGIAPMTSTNDMVDHNTLAGFNVRGVGNNAGMWTANSVTVTFQYNTTSGGVSTRDGMAYDVDHSSDGVVFQYNLSHDNAGGFFLICPYDKPTVNFTIRFNISVNDHARGFQICNGALTNGQIYNNTVYIGTGVSQQIVTESTSATLDVKFTDNIVYRLGSTGTVGWTLSDTSWKNDHNVLFNVPNPSGATNTVTTDPKFTASGTNDPNGYRLLTGSPAHAAGVAITGNGGLDYFGNTIPSTPNIGAYQGAGL